MAEQIHGVHKLQEWSQEGRAMPKYVFGYGSPYVAFLLGVYNGPLDESYNRDLSFEKGIAQVNPDIWKLLLGPNGWAIMKCLIARKGLNDEEI